MTHEFKHPKYYTELRKRNKALRLCDAYSKENSNYTERQQSDQVISSRVDVATSSAQRATGPGLKLPGPRPISNANKGLIHRRQASSNKLKETQASSDKHQAPRHKRQA